MKVTPYPTKVKHFADWRVNILDDEPFTFLDVVNGKSVDTGILGVTVIRTKGRKTVTHGVQVPASFTKVYHGNCRIEITQTVDGRYHWVRCL